MQGLRFGELRRPRLQCFDMKYRPAAFPFGGNRRILDSGNGGFKPIYRRGRSASRSDALYLMPQPDFARDWTWLSFSVGWVKGELWPTQTHPR